jgi:hypothetical protein
MKELSLMTRVFLNSVINAWETRMKTDVNAWKTEKKRRKNGGKKAEKRVKNVPFKMTFLYACLKQLHFVFLNITVFLSNLSHQRDSDVPLPLLSLPVA